MRKEREKGRWRRRNSECEKANSPRCDSIWPLTQHVCVLQSVEERQSGKWPRICVCVSKCEAAFVCFCETTCLLVCVCSQVHACTHAVCVCVLVCAAWGRRRPQPLHCVTAWPVYRDWTKSAGTHLTHRRFIPELLSEQGNSVDLNIEAAACWILPISQQWNSLLVKSSVEIIYFGISWGASAFLPFKETILGAVLNIVHSRENE